MSCSNTFNIYLNAFLEKGFKEGKLVDMSDTVEPRLCLENATYPYLKWCMGSMAEGTFAVEMAALGFLATLISSHKPQGHAVGLGIVYFRELPHWEHGVLKFRYCIV